MLRHIVCYVQQKRITDWKRLVLTRDEPTFIYGSNDARVFPDLGSNDSIWVVSSLPGRPPQLVARLSEVVVRERGDPRLGVDPRVLDHFEEFRWIARGGTGSEFFGHNEAGTALMETVFETTSGRPWMLAPGASRWEGRFGTRLQRPTQIFPEGASSEGFASPGAAPLLRLAATGARSVFISWKWADHPDRTPILTLAHALADERLMPWLDLLALPRARATAVIERDAAKLAALLRYGYRRSAVILAVESARYGTRSPRSDANWTLREWTGALSPRRAHLPGEVPTRRPGSDRACRACEPHPAQQDSGCGRPRVARRVRRRRLHAPRPGAASGSSQGRMRGSPDRRGAPPDGCWSRPHRPIEGSDMTTMTDDNPLPTTAAVPSADARNWAVLSHISAFVGFLGIPSLIGPLVVWLLRREDPYVDYHAKEALNFNISFLLYSIVSAALILLLVGLLLLPVVLVAWFVLVIVGSVKAAGGEYYRYPATIRFIT